MDAKLLSTLVVALAASTLAACQQDTSSQASVKPATDIQAGTVIPAKVVQLGSGIDFSGFDKSIRPQDDLFGHVNGGWLANTEIPGDRARWGTFDKLREQSREEVRSLVQEVSRATGVEPGSPSQKIRDYYNTYMDMHAATELGLAAISNELDAIDAAQSLDDVYRLWGEFQQYSVAAPIRGAIFSDLKDPDRNEVYLMQAGLTLPDRDYYLKDDEQFSKGRQLYLDYAESIFTKAGLPDPDHRAQEQLAFETRLAKPMWTREENRDWSKRHNPRDLAGLKEMSPRASWEVMLDAAQIPGRHQYLVSQPSYFEAMDDIVADTELATLKDYLRLKTISSFAPVLGDDWYSLHFEFFNKGLSGTDQPEELWKRAISSVNSSMGELLGQLYVEKHFAPEAKARMDEMIGNLVAAYEVSIKELEWMGDETRQQALDKLHKFNAKIGFPDEWIDYSKLKVSPDSLIDNVRSAQVFAYNRQLDKLDKPVDKAEWLMTPQTVNAYYYPVWNEIVFPASNLQPPFFNVEADDAVNYGAIGAVIGHEIGHGFDDSGKRFDGDGILRDWWTPEDLEKFEVRKNALAAQYDSYEVIDGLTVNGQFTSGENIGDLGGLSIAHLAYRMSLQGSEAPVIDDLTGDQRFFIGWAQVWRTKARPEETKRRLTTDTHSPARFRTNGAAVNVPAFYAAFDVTQGDGMYLPPEDRVKIW